MMGMIKVGHRGVGEGVNENTICAVKKAIDVGMDMVELDVRLTKDRVPVIIHDDVISGAGGGVRVSELTWEELRSLGLPECSRVPSLKEVLDFVKGKIGLVLDIKEARCEKEIVDALRHYVEEMLIIVTSFDATLLVGIKSMLPQIRVALMSVGLEKDVIEDVASVFDALFVYLPFIGRDIVEELHKVGCMVFAWVADTVEDMMYAAKLGVDGVVINNASVLVEGVV